MGQPSQRHGPDNETGLLYRLADAANRARRPEDVFEPALDAITQGLRVERASILLAEADGVMRFRAWRGLSHGYRAAVEGHSPWHPDETDPLPVLVPDVLEDAGLRPYLPLFQAEDIRALGFIPLVHQKRLVGKFMIYSATPRELGSAEVQFAVTTASHVAQAVARAQLYAEAEAARRQAEAASRTKDEFISLLGHELRNPLSPILTALHLMRLRDDSRFQRERGVIERQVRHLARLVDDLLDVSRIARGMVELRRARVPLEQVVSKAIEMAAPLLEERQQHLEVRLPPGLGNLLHNAAKFTESKGQVRISAEQERQELVLRVSDTGCGLSAELVPRLFEMFSQARGDGASQGGLGLGLAIVRSLVELHGGTVSAHSAGLGLGSEFVVRLPSAVSLGAPEPQQAPSGEPHPRTRRRVLVVDDNVDAASYLAEALREVGHVVHCANDGPQALRSAERFGPEVALLDIGMPVMDGYELAQRLVAQPGLSELKLVAVTGYGQESDRARSAQHGFVAHLTKPVELDMLLQVIERLGR
jgi:signal transduction histidine kinase